MNVHGDAEFTEVIDRMNAHRRFASFRHARLQDDGSDNNKRGNDTTEYQSVPDLGLAVES